MKIQVVRIDGSIEVLNLVGTIEANEPGTELEYPRNQSPLYVKDIGMRYFFREDGRYDGWEAEVNQEFKSEEEAWEFTKKFAAAVEADCEHLPPPTGTER